MKNFWLLIGLGWLMALGIMIALLLHITQKETIVFTDLEGEGTPEILATDPVRGNLATGTVPIVTYSNFSCENCKQMNVVLEDFLARHPDTLIHVWKDLPNATVNSESQRASVAARCAQKQGAFWEYHELLYRHQVSQGAELYLSIAKELDLNTGRFERCVAAERPLEWIRANVTEADELDVVSAPTLFIGEQRFTGEVTLDALEAALAK